MACINSRFASQPEEQPPEQEAFLFDEKRVRQNEMAVYAMAPATVMYVNMS